MCNVLCFSGKPSLFVWGREIKKRKNIVISSLSSDSCKRRRSQQEEEGPNETNYGFYFYRCLQTKSLRRMFNWGHWRRWRHSTLQKISRAREIFQRKYFCAPSKSRFAHPSGAFYHWSDTAHESEIKGEIKLLLPFSIPGKNIARCKPDLFRA